MIPFNKPYISGTELEYVKDAISRGKISGNGHYSKLCHNFFESYFENAKCLLTTSCTDALEMSAILSEIKPGDEVIIPSFTFCSTANAFALRGAQVVFCDSLPNHPNIDPQEIEKKITKKTKAIVVVHYAGMACDMDSILELIQKHNLILIEDAAQAISSYYKNNRLGSFGKFAAFSFHETKNIHCGEGGLIVTNDEQYFSRSEIIWEKGTNRAAFNRGEVGKYNWVDIGSSFLLSDLNAAFLYAQLENIEDIQKHRLNIWDIYKDGLKSLQELEHIMMLKQFDYGTNNAHLFAFTCRNERIRNELITFLKERQILAVFHYLPLHSSPYFKKHNKLESLPNAKYFSETIIRLPLYVELSYTEQSRIISTILEFFS